MALKDIQIPKTEVPVGADSSFAVRGLSTSDLQHLLQQHGESMRDLFKDFVNGGATQLSKLELGPIVKELLERAPALVHDVISLAADADEEDRAMVPKLPASSQLAALGAVFTLTLSTDGELGNGLEALTTMLGGLNEVMAEKMEQLTSR